MLKVFVFGPLNGQKGSIKSIKSPKILEVSGGYGLVILVRAEFLNHFQNTPKISKEFIKQKVVKNK